MRRFTTLALCATTLLLAGAGTASATNYPAPSKQEHLYTIPVGAVTDLGDLTKVSLLGQDFAHLLGQ
ncbi:hypothetical protein [Kitasatospora viridis]|uniref:Uncharacterized protein n=1 Tax=Kitasatospora viridis TaxID=281105 RepID=A0A561UQ51_9ACTN|nr:hypothetical protein [Kitasatospora viridis]TWG01485.1 hypothetical protein FHX73_115386 [Kitasatospora viridis]